MKSPRLFKFTARLAAHLATFVLILLACQRTLAQSHFIITLRCHDTATISLAPLLVGDTTVDTVSLVNNFSGDTLGITTGSSILSFSNTRIGILRGDTGRVFLKFRPDSASQRSFQFVISQLGDTCSETLTVVARGINPTPDSITLPLVHNSSNVIAIQTNGPTTLRTIYLKNNTGAAVEFDSLFCMGASDFSVVSPIVSSSQIVTVTVGDSLRCTLRYAPSSKGPQNGEFIAKPNHVPITDAFSYVLEGLSYGIAAVESPTARNTSFVKIYPNPSAGAVTLHIASSIGYRASICDALGRTICTTSSIGDWQWDRRTSNGSFATPGSYFAIVMLQNGEHCLVPFVLE